jgi:hypothetical protein
MTGLKPILQVITDHGRNRQTCVKKEIEKNSIRIIGLIRKYYNRAFLAFSRSRATVTLYY